MLFRSEKVAGVSCEKGSLVRDDLLAEMAGAWWQDLGGRWPIKGPQGFMGGGEAV